MTDAALSLSTAPAPAVMTAIVEQELLAQPERCSLLGGTFAILVQVGLMVSAIATLIYKRSAERPRRPWLVWFFDASKQGFAGVLQHLVNIGFGMLFAQKGAASECSWYIVSFTISVACGVVILWAVMRAYNWAVDRFHLTLLRSGEYGSPPTWKPWLAQLLIWGFLASAEKGVTAVLVIVPLHSHLDEFASWIEGPLIAYPYLELVLVMVVAPVLLNAVFFWVIDNIIMRKRSSRHADVDKSGDEDDEELAGEDDKQPLLEEMDCSCCPPFTPTAKGPEADTSRGKYTPASPAVPASRCRDRSGMPTTSHEVI